MLFTDANGKEIYGKNDKLCYYGNATEGATNLLAIAQQTHKQEQMEEYTEHLLKHGLPNLEYYSDNVDQQMQRKKITNVPLAKSRAAVLFQELDMNILSLKFLNGPRTLLDSCDTANLVVNTRLTNTIAQALGGWCWDTTPAKNPSLQLLQNVSLQKLCLQICFCLLGLVHNTVVFAGVFG